MPKGLLPEEHSSVPGEQWHAPVSTTGGPDRGSTTDQQQHHTKCKEVHTLPPLPVQCLHCISCINDISFNQGLFVVCLPPVYKLCSNFFLFCFNFFLYNTNFSAYQVGLLLKAQRQENVLRFITITWFIRIWSSSFRSIRPPLPPNLALDQGEAVTLRHQVNQWSQQNQGRPSPRMPLSMPT